MFRSSLAVQGLLTLRLCHGAAAVGDLWVSVDDSGVPKTITPVISTVSGTPTAVSDAPPFKLTATVRTKIIHGYVTTSTGLSLPTADANSKNGAGAFPICHHKAGLGAPFCFPTPGSTLHPGTTYYITWDPAFFSSSNTTIVVFGSHRNATNGVLSKEDAFASSAIPVTKAFYAWSVDHEIMQHTPGVNISIGLRTLPVGNSSNAPARGPDVYVTKALPFRQPPSTPPSGPELYIGLPIIFAFITLMLIGTLVWGKKYRNIGLGNVMSRGRRGGYQKLGSGRSRRSRGDPKESIGLMNIDAEADDGNQGRFSIDSDDSTGSDARPARHRRMS
ncbi:hypothetical protein MAPG_07706 [Magnaporthiopsis poae ATCC 64411]|uniref:Uncharacterized protein n=1 Tax=Magnaporthiopsis poae (strain ATCC 64411 / 73-15) TaxID=644358 RepID=A0A0C4E5E0_MAGP6|nr:hypothetical protein MAPG_07706 [Magnaporthiopsis poae ATCC 64411]